MVYKIVEYDMIGKKLYTQEEMPMLSVVDDIRYSGRKRFVYTGTTEEYGTSRLWTLTDKPKADAIDSKVEFLPYFADVTEDLPSYVKFKPKTWKNCQLMSETHGGYKQFYHKRSKKVLRIAINSHFYNPVENTTK